MLATATMLDSSAHDRGAANAAAPLLAPCSQESCMMSMSVVLVRNLVSDWHRQAQDDACWCRVLALLMLCDIRLDKQDVHDMLDDCQKPLPKVMLLPSRLYLVPWLVARLLKQLQRKQPKPTRLTSAAARVVPKLQLAAAVHGAIWTWLASMLSSFVWLQSKQPKPAPPTGAARLTRGAIKGPASAPVPPPVPEPIMRLPPTAMRKQPFGVEDKGVTLWLLELSNRMGALQSLFVSQCKPAEAPILRLPPAAMRN